MVMRPEVRQRVLAALEELAETDTSFTFSTLRDRAGVEPRGDERGALWSLWESLREKGVVEEVDTGQKRNRLYHVADLRQLRGLTPGRSLISGRENADTPGDRLKRLERAMQELTERVEQLIRQWS